MTNEPTRLTVDGRVFSITRDATQENTYHFEWVDEGEPPYGFSIRRSSGGVMDNIEAEHEIRQFLAQIDPVSRRIR